MINDLLNSIIAVISLSLLSMILPNGKSVGLIKWVISIAMTLCLIMPIISIFKDFKFNKTIEKNSSLQVDYLVKAINLKEDIDRKNLEEYLSSIGVNGAEILIESDVIDYEINYKKIQINLKNSVINSDKTHINIVNEIKGFIQNYFGESVVIEIYG